MPPSSSAMSDSPPITKLLFASGVQCAKRLYLDYHYPERIPELPPDRQELAETGRKLVSLARTAFPNGITVDEEGEAAVQKTAEILSKPGPVAIFDAAFRSEDIEVRTDIALRDTNGELDVFEVKSGTKVKPRHILDLALQAFTIEGMGLKVRNTVLLHVNPQYRHEGGAKYPVNRLFKNLDVTAKVRRRLERVANTIPSFRSLLVDESTLDLPMGTWCTQPFVCPYFERCSAQAPKHPLLELPDITRSQEYALHEQAIEDVTQVDPDQPGLTLRQRRALRAVREGGLVVEPFVTEELDEVESPIHFVSIQYLLEVLPRYEGTRPWQALPYHWSDCVLSEDGSVELTQFLARDRSDPRPEFVRRLYEQLQGAGSLLFFSPYHEHRLRSMLDDVTAVKSMIRAVLNLPIVELGRLVDSGVYHAEFRGRFDLESVAHALISDYTANGPEISNPRVANLAYQRMLRPRTKATTRDELSEQIAALGARESESIMKIYLRLKQA